MLMLKIKLMLIIRMITHTLEPNLLPSANVRLSVHTEHPVMPLGIHMIKWCVLHPWRWSPPVPEAGSEVVEGLSSCEGWFPLAEVGGQGAAGEGHRQAEVSLRGRDERRKGQDKEDQSQ